MSGPEHYEQLLAFIATHMPTPCEQEERGDEVVFVGGDPGEVVVRLTGRAVIVEEYAVRWEGAGQPVLRPRRVGAVRWRRLPESALMTVVGQLIKGARETRRARFRACIECGQTKAPELMRTDDLCRACAARAPAPPRAEVVH